jgi:PHYB activation tagged suppressor 1
VNDGMAGKTHFWWLGWEARIVITELDLVKEIFANKNGSYEKSQIQLRFQSQLLGKGLVTTNGEEWVTHRQTVTPAFHHEKIKVQFREHVRCMFKNNT